LLLCNIYKASVEELSAGRKKWPLGVNEKNSIEELGALMAHLKTEIDAGLETDFRPAINQCSQEGLIKDTINGIVSSHHVFMAIISMHSSKSFTSFLARNHTWDVIKQISVPLLVIPYQVRFKNYNMIAFATDLTNTDKYVLNSIVGLAKHTGADVLVTHVVDNETILWEEESHIEEFFNKDAIKYNNPTVFYHAIKSSSVKNALKEIMQDVSIDMLALIKRPHNVFQKILERNVIRRLAIQPAKPLLIFPDNSVMGRPPVF